MTCLNDKNSNIVEPLLLSFFIKNLYHTLDHEQPYKKGSSSSIWKKNKKKIFIPKEPFICHPLQ